MEDGEVFETFLDMLLICFAGFLIVTVIILYGKLLLIARHQARRIAAAEINAEDAQVQLHRSNVRSLKTFLIITATVCITWLPTVIFLSLQDPNRYIDTAFQCLRYNNSWLNTVIYSWRNETFKKIAKKLVCRKRKQ